MQVIIHIEPDVLYGKLRNRNIIHIPQKV